MFGRKRVTRPKKDKKKFYIIYTDSIVVYANDVSVVKPPQDGEAVAGYITFEEGENK